MSNIVAHETRLTKENALQIFKDYDIIVDGADNFATRYLVNDACVLLGKPNVHGSIFRFEGQATVFDADTALLPLPLPRSAPARPRAELRRGGCAGRAAGHDRGAAGNGSGQADSGIGKPLTGRLLLYDALDATFREMRLNKDPACPVCGETHFDSLATSSTPTSPARSPSWPPPDQPHQPGSEKRPPDTVRRSLSSPAKGPEDSGSTQWSARAIDRRCYAGIVCRTRIHIGNRTWQVSDVPMRSPVVHDREGRGSGQHPARFRTRA